MRLTALCLTLLVYTLPGNSEPENPQLALLSRCLGGLLSQPYSSDKIAPKARGQAIYVEQVMRMWEGHVFNTIVLPRFIEGSDRISFTALFSVEPNHQLRSQTMTFSASELKPPFGEIVVFPGVNSVCTLGGTANGAACPSLPLALKVKIVPYPDGKRKQVILEPVTSEHEIVEGKKNTRTGKINDDQNPPQILADILTDLTETVKYADEHLTDKDVTPKNVLDAIKRCRESAEKIKAAAVHYTEDDSDVKPGSALWNASLRFSEAAKEAWRPYDVEMQIQSKGVPIPIPDAIVPHPKVQEAGGPPAAH